VNSKTSGDHSRALIYANECAEIRKIAKIIINGQLALEQVILRLETIEELGEIFVQMGPIVNVVQEIQGQLTGVLPEVSHELGEINSALNSAVVEAGNASENPSIPIPISEEEAERVLAEANVIADERMKEYFPFLPDPLETPEKTADGDIENRVYEYIKSLGDKTISVKACASALQLSPGIVKKTISSLTEQKRLLLEQEKS